MSKAHGNNTDITNTDFSDIEDSDTYPFLSSEKRGLEAEGKNKYLEYYDYFYEHLEYEYVYPKYPYDKEMLDNILELIIETMCSTRKLIRIASDDKPIEIVRSRFMKLNSGHIEYVMYCIKENTTKVRNIKQYLLATLFNAPTTMDSYYDCLVRHDMAYGTVFQKGGD